MKILIVLILSFSHFILFSQDISHIEGKLVVGGTTSQASLINVNGTTPSMLRLQGTGSSGAYQQFYSNNSYWGLIGDEDGDGSDLYFDIKSRSGAAGIAMSTGLTNNALLIENNGKADFSKSIEVGNEPSGSAPTAGTIRWNGKDFQGYDGNNWKSLTQGAISNNGVETVTDIDGNVYKTVEIGTQTWMRENLRVTRYQDGTAIAEFTLFWNSGSNGGWCWYANNCEYDQVYGKLYSRGAVINSKGLCPSGWKAPDEDDWQTLNSFLSSNQGNLLKTAGTIDNNDGLWASPNGGTNMSAWSGKPGGQRTNAGFDGLSTLAGFWSTSTQSIGLGMVPTFYELSNTSSALIRKTAIENEGLSVRCVKLPD